MGEALGNLQKEIRACRLCADDFLKTATKHEPRPVAWLSAQAPIVIAGQAPGIKVHESGRPFTDPSGDRLRDWLGVNEARFYDQRNFAVLPMAFCFPGYNAKGADLPPPKRCAETWQAQAYRVMPQVKLTLLIGGYSQKYYLGDRAKDGVTKTVANWRDFLPKQIPLPHPSWRNSGWLKKNPWFEADLLPVLRKQVADLLGG